MLKKGIKKENVMTYTILGAGLSGLSCSYHIGHKKCTILESKMHSGGHIYSYEKEGFVWDEGPHVSFTQNNYVKNLFAKSVNNNFNEFSVHVENYFHGSWIPHPAQSNLHAIPEPLRTKCLNSFLTSREVKETSKTPEHYGEWLEKAFGKIFSQKFPRTYTKKYWTVYPEDLTTDWVGDRMYYPKVDIVKNGYKNPQTESTHYIKTARYPKKNGFYSFAKNLISNANIIFNSIIQNIDLENKRIKLLNGDYHDYEKLINTIPLPEFIRLANAPKKIVNAANQLSCTSLLLINVIAPHPPKLSSQWFYVYDEDKLSTRVNNTGLMSSDNVPNGKTGIQVEVYFSKYEPQKMSNESVAEIVCEELLEMGVIDSFENVHTNLIPYANIIYDHPRRENQNIVLEWLEGYGLIRESDDLEPMTDWNNVKPKKLGDLSLAGRFAQWKYSWSDDCVLRGKYLASRSNDKLQ
jgi:protoporphyrinogen oxidase